MPKYLFVTGGVMSGLGKGITASSVAKLLELSGLEVTCLKIDPYLNFDAGTMNPVTHGEVFVTDDGGETDMDLGTYERFLNRNMSKASNITTGQVYKKVIDDERRGKFLGKSVQIIPHITDEIKRRIRQLAVDSKVDVLVVECGGTVGDIESQPFLEAIRQFRNEAGKQNAIFVHLTWVPFIKTAGEVKTKPTQHSVKALREIGIQPDILLCRTEDFLSEDIKAKISLFCNVEVSSVFTAKDVKCVYEVPIVFHKEGVDNKIVELLNIWTGRPHLEAWEDVADKKRKPSDDQKRLLLDQLEIIKNKLGKRELKSLALDEKQAADCRRLIESL
jgi:CTP synthase